jgi:uncharacterized membrane protein
MKTHEEYLQSQKRVLWLTYILNMLLVPALLGFAFNLTNLYILVVPAILGVVISLTMLYQYRHLSTERYAAMADDVTMFWGHHLWLFRTFIITITFSMASLGTIYYGYGYVLAAGVVVWWMYRILRGVTSLFTFHPVPVWR